MNPLKFLSKDEILKAEDLKVEPVEVPEWGGTVNVRGLTGVERDDWEESRLDRKAKLRKGQATPLKLSNFRASLVVRTVCNDRGELLFGDKDIVLLGKKSAIALSRVFEVAMRLSGVSEDDVEELAEDLDEEASEGSSSS